MCAAKCSCASPSRSAHSSSSKRQRGRVSSTISPPAAVVADANVVVSALIGGRARLAIAFPHPPRCVAAKAVALEIARHIPRLANKRRLDRALLFAALQVMPIEWKPTADYHGHRDQAERRIAARPRRPANRRALALTLGLPVWSQDIDLTSASLYIYTTGDLLDALRDVGHLEQPGLRSKGAHISPARMHAWMSACMRAGYGAYGPRDC
jgi:predicted nucleic acid-binding protein